METWPSFLRCRGAPEGRRDMCFMAFYLACPLHRTRVLEGLPSEEGAWHDCRYCDVVEGRPVDRLKR